MTTTAALIDSALMAVEWHKDQGCMISLVIKEMARHGPSHRALFELLCTVRVYESFNWLDWVSDSAFERRKGRLFLDDRHAHHART